MKTKLIVLVIAAISLSTCRGGSSARRDQRNYEVVDEGSADGVTSTIHAPGETPPPLTDTNVDTTTAFTLPTTQSSLPPNTAGASAPGYPPPTYPVPVAPPPTPTPTRVIVTPPSPQPQPPPAPSSPAPSRRPEPQPEPAPEPPPTDTTTTTTAPSPPTDTAKEPPPPPPPGWQWAVGGGQ